MNNDIARSTFNAYMNINMYDIESCNSRGENHDGWVRMRYSKQDLFRMQQLLDYLICELIEDKKKADVYRISILEAICKETLNWIREPRKCAKMWYSLSRKAFDTEDHNWLISFNKEIKSYEIQPYVPPAADSDDESE